ncbi:Bug family tripartite tricarboxylate transporter substrate binding protein [Pseudorhodoferax sp. LjRoot39]|uniref:Bug family tripartite tricarboxylate transporter substrate binding protein n=1 Tax=Pseudorhodoferax sp. LjRoot39 TaxID=3342328 RepID=UPI003F505E99
MTLRDMTDHGDNKSGRGAVVRSRIVRTLLVVAALFAWGSPAGQLLGFRASDPLTLVVPYGPGGSIDIVGRTMASAMSEELQRPVVVLNKAGAAGAIGMAALARSPADGKVVGMGTVSTLAVLPAARGAVPYSAASFEPVGLIASAPAAVLVSARMGVETLDELIAVARAQPGTFNFGSVGDGSVVHLTGQMFMAATGVDLAHVPYNSVTKLLPDLAAGRIHVLFDQLSAVPAAYLQSGAVRILAILGPRAPGYPPDVPTAAQAGLPGLQVQFWSGLLAPAGTPRADIDKINAALNEALGDEKVRAAFGNLGLRVEGGTPEKFRELIRREQFLWGSAAEAALWKANAPNQERSSPQR